MTKEWNLFQGGQTKFLQFTFLSDTGLFRWSSTPHVNKLKQVPVFWFNLFMVLKNFRHVWGFFCFGTVSSIKIKLIWNSFWNQTKRALAVLLEIKITANRITCKFLLFCLNMAWRPFFVTHFFALIICKPYKGDLFWETIWTLPWIICWMVTC